LSSAAKDVDIFEIKYERKKPVAEKLISFGANILDSIDGR